MDIIAHLQREPGAFDFLQVVRLLERFTYLEQGQRTLGHWLPPTKEGVRFRATIGLGFPARSIDRVASPETDNNRAGAWQLTTSQMNLTGACGVMPYTYTEWLQASIKNRDANFWEFLECFHHRTLSLYYRALVKYRLPVAYDKALLEQTPVNNMNPAAHCPTGFIQALIGRYRDGAGNHTPIFFSAFHTQAGRSAIALEKLIAFYFEISVRVVDFVGAWSALDAAARCRLGCRHSPHEANNCLGKTVLLGKRAWLAQQKIRIELGPLSDKRLDMFSAQSKARAEVYDLVSGFLGGLCDIEFKVIVQRAQLVDRARLAGALGPALGWDTALSSRHGLQERAESLCRLSFR